ncbi:AIR synthase related protein [[Eubacterium] cellulosolvens]
MRGTSSRPSVIKTARDIRLFRPDRRRIIVVSCDSAGGIGPKPLDKVQVDGRTVGRFTARAALMEVLSVGATPICLANTLTVEPKPTGMQIIKGIRDEVKYAGLDSRIVMTQSTEKNIRVSQTGVGVTVVATAISRSLRIGRCRPGDVIVAIGLPHVGDEVIQAEKERRIADTRDIRSLLNLPFVHEIIPVGSQGILHEALTIASDSNLRFKLGRGLGLDVRKSAGPATVALCACSAPRLKDFFRSIKKPVNLVGSLN